MSALRTLSPELTEQEAMALAQFVKRAGFSDAMANASGEEEAYLMLSAFSKVRDDLAAKGFSPR